MGAKLKLNEFSMLLTFPQFAKMLTWSGELRFIGHVANEDVTIFFAANTNMLKSHEVELSDAKMFEEE